MDTPAFDPARFIRFALRSLVVCCLALVMSITMVKLAQAAGTVPASPNYCLINYFNGGPTCGFSSAAAACVAVGAMVQSDGRCLSPNGYYYYYTYGSSGCPANSTGTTTCTCTDPYVPDPAGTSCVPVPAVTCSVTTKVADITDPVAKLYEDGTYSTTRPDLVHLTPATQTGLACIQQKVAALNCYMTPQPTSGYRPTAYQKHILEVYDKWQLIKDNNTPECAATKAAIEKEFKKHSRFARRPGATSNHSQVDAQGNPAGEAVDISFVPDDANISADAIACQCNMYRPLINMPDPTKNDPVHYQPRICPR